LVYYIAQRVACRQADDSLTIFKMAENPDIVRRLQAGDANALAEYIELHRPQLLAYIEHQLGPGLRSKVEPDDVLQEVSATAVRSLKAVNSEGDPFSWLCQIAQHKIIDSHRHFFGAQKRAAAREVPIGMPGGDTNDAALIDLLKASMTTASQVFSRNQKEIRLLAALAQLPADYRQAIELRYGQNLGSKEIAAQLGKSDGAVRVMLTRALAALREKLGPI
jgi:RNA polymerase sigma-70 factor (ECF subfamily)